MDIIFRRRIEDIEIPFSGITDLEDAGHIPAPVAVIRRTPDGAQPVVVQYLIALLTQLMGSQDVRHAVHLEELADYLRPEGIPCPTRREGELVAFGVGIRPYQVGHGTFVRNLTESVDDLDLINGVDGRGETAVYAEDLVVDHHAQSQEIKHVGEIVPDVGVAVFPSTLGIEPVRLGNPAGFMISADKMDALGVSQFQANEQRDGLHAEEATIHIITCNDNPSVTVHYQITHTETPTKK